MPASKTTSDRNVADGKGFTAEEKAAMRERAREEKAERSGKVSGEQDLLAKIADLPEPDRLMAERIHEIVKANAPDLAPRTWYGMPAWARDGKVVCFFTPAAKFKERYASFGFNATANLDEGHMWPTAWALTKVTATEANWIGELVKKAVS
jgi:uncharacterized protein YdhG (YjbR/CyaY superfamily)